MANRLASPASARRHPGGSFRWSPRAQSPRPAARRRVAAFQPPLVPALPGAPTSVSADPQPLELQREIAKLHTSADWAQLERPGAEQIVTKGKPARWRSIAGRLCGSTSARGSDRALAASPALPPAGGWVRLATMMPSSASGRRTVPPTRELRRPRTRQQNRVAGRCPACRYGCRSPRNDRYRPAPAAAASRSSAASPLPC